MSSRASLRGINVQSLVSTSEGGVCGEERVRDENVPADHFPHRRLRRIGAVRSLGSYVQTIRRVTGHLTL